MGRKERRAQEQNREGYDNARGARYRTYQAQLVELGRQRIQLNQQAA